MTINKTLTILGGVYLRTGLFPFDISQKEQTNKQTALHMETFSKTENSILNHNTISYESSFERYNFVNFQKLKKKKKKKEKEKNENT